MNAPAGSLGSTYHCVTYDSPPVDPRVQAYARVLVDCIKPEPGWQVLVRSQPAARPLIEEVSASSRAAASGHSSGSASRRAAAARSSGKHRWSCSGTLSEIELHEIETANAYVAIVAPDNTVTTADIPAERLAARQATLREPHVPYLSDEKPWVGCYFPTTGAAQDAGLPLARFRGLPVRRRPDRLGMSCAEKMQRIAEHFDRRRDRPDRRRRRPTSPSASPAAKASSMRSARTCPAARSSTRRSRTPPKE